jgi:hypothetical protein
MLPAFHQECEAFDEWLTEMTNRRIPGCILSRAGGQTRFNQSDRQGPWSCHLSGYLLVIDEGFFDRDHFQDTFYALI